MRWLACLCCLLLCRPALPAPATPEKDTPAAKLRKALDQIKDFEVPSQPLAKFAETLGEQTGIRFVVDPAMHTPLQGLNTLQLSGLPMVGLRGSRLRIGPAVSAVLAPHGLSYVILGDKVLLTTTARATHLALRQRVSLSVENVALEAVLRQLGRDKAVNIVLDPQVGKEKNHQLSLRLSDVPLEAAVQVLAASAGLEAVRLGNVLFVTMPAKAKALRPAAANLRTPLPAVPVPQFGMGGGMLGALGGNIGGGAGVAGLRGAFGIGGGGFAGALGFAGGAAGAFGIGGGGGLMGMAGGAGIMGVPPQKPRPQKKPEKKTSASLGRAVKGTAALLLVAARHEAFPAPQQKGSGKSGRRANLARRARQTQAKLARLVTLPAVDDPAITLGQMLRQLEIKYDLPQFLFNEAAFKAEQVADPVNSPVAEKKLDAVKDIRLATYLRLLLSKVAVASGATYVIRGDSIEITTRQALLAEFYGNRSKKEFPTLPPLVHVNFDQKPLDEALRELSEVAENYNIAMKSGLKEAKLPVTASFHNVPVDTAAGLLANMAGLAVVRRGNVLYVTDRQAARPPRSVRSKPAQKKP